MAREALRGVCEGGVGGGGGGREADQQRLHMHAATCHVKPRLQRCILAKCVALLLVILEVSV